SCEDGPPGGANGKRKATKTKTYTRAHAQTQNATRNMHTYTPYTLHFSRGIHSAATGNDSSQTSTTVWLGPGLLRDGHRQTVQAEADIQASPNGSVLMCGVEAGEPLSILRSGPLKWRWKKGAEDATDVHETHGDTAALEERPPIRWRG